MPAFRPFSFLTTLADRVGELANGDGTNGDDEKPAELPPTVPAVDDDGGAALPALDATAKDDVWARVQLARTLRRPRTLEFMQKLGSRFGKGRGVATVDGEVACEGLLSFIIPPEGTLR